jgi:hypothetical protein
MANSNQLWTCVGITVHNGNAKVRFGVDRVRRIKQFTKGGATRIDLVDLPSEMNKLDALNFLKAHAEFQAPEDQAVISEAYDYRAKVATKTVGEVKVRTPKAKAKPSLDSIKARAKKVAPVTAEEVVAVVAEAQATE